MTTRNLSKQKKKQIIGIVGGMGPHAGIDLVRKIFKQTNAQRDQDHLPVFMLSTPQIIPDRTEFILGKTQKNPAEPISALICQLYEFGVKLVGIPCNTAHARPIYLEILNRVPQNMKIIHMINKIAEYIVERYPSATNVGVLSTTGTLVSNVYHDALSLLNLNAIQVSKEIQDVYIQTAIYHKNFGLKSGHPVMSIVTKHLQFGLEYLIKKNVDVIVLGCTELSLVLTKDSIQKVPIIDSTRILARSLFLADSPQNLLES